MPTEIMGGRYMAYTCTYPRLQSCYNFFVWKAENSPTQL